MAALAGKESPSLCSLVDLEHAVGCNGAYEGACSRTQALPAVVAMHTVGSCARDHALEKAARCSRVFGRA
eukprot:10461175-Alexandrium_andersonii.AAC.1